MNAKGKRLLCDLNGKWDGVEGERVDAWCPSCVQDIALCLEGPSVCLNAPAGRPLRPCSGRGVATHITLCSHMKRIAVCETANQFEQRISLRADCVHRKTYRRREPD